MKRYLKLIYVFVVLFIILGVSYAWYNYRKVSDSDATLIIGNIYLRLNEDTNAINVTNAFPESSESARSKTDNTLEFTVYGKNELSDDIYYEIFLNHGDDITDKVRIDDNELAFDLVRINNDNTETMLLDAVSYDDLNNKKIWVDYVEANTNTEISQKYKLRMWIANKVTFGESDDAKYTHEEFKNLFASIKIGVDGKLKEKSFPLQYQYDETENSFLLTTRNDYVERDANENKEDVVKVLISDPKNHVKMSCVDTKGTTHTDEESLNLVYVFEKNKEVNSVVKIDDIDKYGSDVKFEVYKNEVKVHEFTRTVYKEKTNYKEIGTITYSVINQTQTLYEGKKNLVNRIIEDENFMGWTTEENGELEYRLGDEINLTGEITLYPVYAERVNINLDSLELEYTGTNINNPIVVPEEVEIVEELSTLNATNVGKYKIVLRLKDKEHTTWSDGTTSDKTITWEIEPQDINDVTVNGITNADYTGNAIVPEMTLMNNSQELQENSDYEVEITNNTNAGEATVTITGKGNYTGTKIEHFTINKLVINIPETPTDKNYNKEVQQSGITIPNKTSVVVESSTLSATNVGNYNVVLSLDDTVNTEWSNHTTINQTITWKIVGYSLTNAIVNYDGTTVIVKVPIPSGSTTTLVNNTDYTYTVNTVSGVATVEVTGKGNYSGSKTSTFNVGKNQIEIPSSPTPKAYTGTSQSHGITIPTGTSIVTGSSTLSATDVGSYNVVLSLNNPANDEWEDGTTENKPISWQITAISLENATISGIENKTYTGSAITQSPTITINVNGTTKTLVENTDYTVTTTNNTNAGEATVTITGKGNYSGTKTSNFTINKATITVPSSPAAKTYNAASQDHGITVPANTSIVTASSTVSATNAGTYNVVLQLSNTSNYEWADHTTENKTVTWTINPYNLSNATISGLSAKSYTGSAITQAPTVTVPLPSGSTTTLTNNTHYTYTTTNNTNAGTATVTVTAKASTNYTGSKTANFTINKATIIVPSSPAAKTYNAASQNHGVTVPANTSIVTASSTVSATNAGTYNVVLQLSNTSNYEWNDHTTENKTVTWKINPYNLSNATISGLSAKSYTGSAITQAPTVTVPLPSGSTTTLTNNTHYTYTTTNNTNAGTATVTVTAKASTNYTGSKSANFTINKISPTVTLSPTSVTVVKGKTVTFTETASVAGSFANTSGTTSVATISPANNNSVAANTAKTETVTGVADGTSTITVVFTPTDTTNYNSVTKTLTATITKSAEIPTNSLCVARTYNGSAQQLTSVTSGTGYTLSGYSQTNANTSGYTITATLASGYRWSDNATGTKTFKCVLSKATPTITLSATSGTVVKGKTLTFTEKANVKGKFTVASNATAKATVTQASGNEIAANTAQNVTVTGVADGSATITVKFVPTDTANYNNAADKTYTATITKSAAIPTNSLCVARTYNGSAQQLTSATSGTGYTLSGYSQTNANTSGYTITATLASGYRWSDNATGTKTFKCPLNKATPTITLSATSGTVVAGKTLTFTEKASVAGKFTVSSGTTTVATVTQASNNEIAANTAQNVTVTGVADGSATITVKFVPTDTANYNNAADKTYTATITKSAAIPTNSLCVARTYNGSAQQLTSATSGTGYTLSGYSQTNANTSGYTITATLESGYRWSDNATGTKTFKCVLSKATPTITLSATSGTVVAGKTLVFTEKASVAGKFTVSSGTTTVATVTQASNNEIAANTAQNVTVTGVADGSATITVKFVPTDTANYNNAADKTYAATITKSAAIPTNSLCVARTYNGSAQQLTSATSGTGYTLSGYSQTNANTSGYTITATLASGYRWSDNATGTKTFKCVLSKATPTVTLSPTSVTVVKGKTVTFTEKASIAGSFANTSGTTSVATITPANNNGVAANTAKTETVSGVANGTSTITIVFTPTDTTNYNSVTKTLTATITKSATIPTNSLCVARTYNGSAQQLTSATSGTGYTLSGYSQTNANTGGYTITATLASGYRWSDNATGTKTFKCPMAKATPTITLSATSGTVTVGSTVSFTEKANVKGKFTVASSATGTATVAQASANEIAANTTNKVTVTGKAGGSATITVNFTPTDTTNYNNASAKTYAVAVKKSGASFTTSVNSTTYEYCATDNNGWHGFIAVPNMVGKFTLSILSGFSGVTSFNNNSNINMNTTVKDDYGNVTSTIYGSCTDIPTNPTNRFCYIGARHQAGVVRVTFTPNDTSYASVYKDITFDNTDCDY